MCVGVCVPENLVLDSFFSCTNTMMFGGCKEILEHRVTWVGGGGDGGGREGGRGWRAPFIYTFYESWAYSASLYLRFPPPDS